eukprot:c3817_g1_i1.p1 GENE.c3817_g1_i1~~c3817_g1_i1.p1  ORF type:complete len:351 (-),score=64.22 c3817_g1_i1:112-1164(-)
MGSNKAISVFVTSRMLVATLIVLTFLLGPVWTLLLVASFFVILQIGKCDFVLFFLTLVRREKPSYSGRCVWVTGASSGIGEEMCYQLANAGARLVMSARRVDELERVRKNCKNSSQHIIVPLDLAAHDTHADVVKTVLEKLGSKSGIDILINNAGRSQRGLAELVSLNIVRQQLELNTLGTISLTSCILPHLIARAKVSSQKPQIVVISSLAGKIGAPASSSYSASKHALHGYFDTLRMELTSSGVGVTMLCPGPVVSEGADNAITSSGKAAKEDGSPHSAYHNRRMPTKDACECMLRAVAFRLSESWVSPNPELAMVYLMQYAPTLGFAFGGKIGGARAEAFRKQIKQN